jgi:hypothetical protein
MARHNRDATGEDQRGEIYHVSFQPDWLHQIKVARALESGRQSTKTLVRNTEARAPGAASRTRTRVTNGAGTIDFEITVDDPRGVVTRVTVETEPLGADGAGEVVSFSIDSRRRVASDAAADD